MGLGFRIGWLRLTQWIGGFRVLGFGILPNNGESDGQEMEHEMEAGRM